MALCTFYSKSSSNTFVPSTRVRASTGKSTKKAKHMVCLYKYRNTGFLVAFRDFLRFLCFPPVLAQNGEHPQNPENPPHTGLKKNIFTVRWPIPACAYHTKSIYRTYHSIRWVPCVCMQYQRVWFGRSVKLEPEWKPSPNTFLSNGAPN